MGKASKKVKNDRINTLRKQYDAYLEEDKKRRERNEYILGKLDKMRSSTALVPISTKASYQEINPSEVYVRRDNIRKATTAIYDNYVPPLERQNITSDILSNKHLDESTILKEISKRYILIPKRRMPVDIEYDYHKDVINDNDWRSKYNILDNLKKQEKEGQSDDAIHQNDEILINSYKNPEPINDKQPKYFDRDSNQPSFDIHNKLTDVNKLSSLEKHENKVQKSVDFDIPDINTQIDDKTKDFLQTTPKTSNEELRVNKENTSYITDPTNSPVTCEIIQPHHQECTEDEKYYSENNEKHLNYQPNQNINNDMQINKENIDNNKTFQDSMHLTNYNQSMPESNEYDGYENDSSNSYPKDLVSDVKQQEPSTVECSGKKVNPNENLGNQKDVCNAQELSYSERIDLTPYDDTDNNPGGQIETEESAYETPQHYDPTQDSIPVDTPQHFDPVQDSIPVMIENTEGTEHVDHESEINAFEAEQKEMFYSEQTGGDAYAYNQRDDNTGEYTAENYEPNDQYAYFEGVQQEQAYADVNEHEEATERYDPHYNQQYEGTYENQQPHNTLNYENPNAYEQQQYQEGNYENQQFENVVNYENQQENANLYQQENVSNENEAQENVLIPEGNETYDQQFYPEQSETQEHIEQQLITEEGYVENLPINMDEMKKEHDGETERVMDITNPGEQVLDPKLS